MSLNFYLSQIIISCHWQLFCRWRLLDVVFYFNFVFRTTGVKGILNVNGKTRKLKTFNKLSTYIMQEDLLQPFLTVRESMMAAARLKLGRNISLSDKIAVVSFLTQMNDVEELFFTCGGFTRYLGWRPMPSQTCSVPGTRVGYQNQLLSFSLILTTLISTYICRCQLISLLKPNTSVLSILYVFFILPSLTHPSSSPKIQITMASLSAR